SLQQRSHIHRLPAMRDEESRSFRWAECKRHPPGGELRTQLFLQHPQQPRRRQIDNPPLETGNGRQIIRKLSYFPRAEINEKTLGNDQRFFRLASKSLEDSATCIDIGKIQCNL